MNRMVQKSVAGLLTFLIVCSQNQFVESVEGRLFFLGFMNISTSSQAPQPGIQQIHISCINVNGRVRIQYVPFNRTDIITLSSTNNWQQSITIVPDLSGPTGMRLPAAIIVSAEMAISVQTNKAEDGSQGGYLALPITQSATQFYAAAYTPRTGTSGFTIAAPYDTCIDVRYVTGPTSYRLAYITVASGNTYNFVTPSDVTGFYLSSSKPIALYTGMERAYIPVDKPSVMSWDHIIEQVPPVTQFGTRYILSTSYDRNFQAGYQYRVIGTIRTNVNVVTITFDQNTGAVVSTIAATLQVVIKGQFVEGTVGRGSSNPSVTYLTCDNPCLVMQYSEAYDMVTPENDRPDESMLTIPDIDHYTNDITFSTSKYYIQSSNSSLDCVSGITIICRKSDLSSLLLDGAAITSGLTNPKTLEAPTPASMTQFSPDTYEIIYGGVKPGFHKVTSTSSSAQYMVYVYGYAAQSSPTNSAYAYLGGFKYLTEADPPVLDGPYFDFTQTSPANAGTNTGNTPPSPGPVQVTPADIPIYDSDWEASFTTLVPDVNQDLKTRNCSEAYYRYWIEMRYNPMNNDYLPKFVAANCVNGASVIMQPNPNLPYYSQYTNGKCGFRLRVVPTAGSTATLGDLYDCWQQVSTFISVYKSWYPGYQTVTDFLKNDAPYTQGCSVLHMNTPSFTAPYYGWMCPYAGGVLGSSGANTIKSGSLVTFACLFFVQLFVLKYLR